MQSSAAVVPPPTVVEENFFMNTFGFNTVNVKEDTYLDVETSFFRLFCFERGVRVFRFTILCGLFMQFMALIFEWKDPQVDTNWFFLGQNHVSLGVFYFLFITLLNSFLYPKIERGNVPFPVRLQWMLYVALLPGTSIAAIAYWRLLRGSEHDSGVQAAKATGLAIMIFLGLFGLYEAQWKHLLFSVFILYAHIFYVIILAFFGNFIYASILTLNLVDLVTWGVELTIYNVLIHTGYICIQQYKAYKRQGGTLWKPRTPSLA
jgi:multisubunit Na+/H+ antiporter MnhF subunit